MLKEEKTNFFLSSVFLSIRHCDKVSKLILIEVSMEHLSSHPVESNVANVCKISGNNKCVDCDADQPVWASLGFGTLICLECAGKRSLLGEPTEILTISCSL